MIFIVAAPTLDSTDEEPRTEETEETNDNDSSSDDSTEDSDDQSDGNNDSNSGDNEESSEQESEHNNNDSNENNESSNEEQEAENNNDEESNEDKQSNEDQQEIYWGVDSASYTTEEMYSCVVDNFGEPAVWGRYLGDREGVSAGLDTEEVNYLHEQGIPILVIYNHVNDATGYDPGVEHGNYAIDMAEELGIPEGVALFLDIEPEYPVDSAFMEGWYDTLIDSPYYPAVYGVFDEGSSLLEAYNAMDAEIQENTIVWTAYPQEGVTTKDNAPDYHPQGPESALVYGWQYGLEADACTIDTNLFTNELMDYLWKE